jgi:hypothetical protein
MCFVCDNGMHMLNDRVRYSPIRLVFCILSSSDDHLASPSHEHCEQLYDKRVL